MSEALPTPLPGSEPGPQPDHPGDSTPSLPGPAGGGTPGAESLIAQFEDLWLRGGRPALDDFLPDGAARRAVLVELVHIDLEFRLKAGEAARVETYLGRYPEL